MQFVNDKIQAYETNDDIIKIYDAKGLPAFFFDASKSKKPHRFNLPRGVFYTKNKVTPVGIMVKYKLPKLAKPNRNLKRAKHIKIRYAENPNKCTVYLEKGLIIFDNSLKDIPKFAKEFIFHHEMGHHFYGGYDIETQREKYIQAEKNCDAFAAYQMLLRGYNPSQAFTSVNVLIDNFITRKKAMFNLVKNQKNENKHSIWRGRNTLVGVVDTYYNNRFFGN